jgi:hypothetical protein
MKATYGKRVAWHRLAVTPSAPRAMAARVFLQHPLVSPVPCALLLVRRVPATPRARPCSLVRWRYRMVVTVGVVRVGSARMCPDRPLLPV